MVVSPEDEGPGVGRLRKKSPTGSHSNILFPGWWTFGGSEDSGCSKSVPSVVGPVFGRSTCIGRTFEEKKVQ